MAELTSISFNSRSDAAAAFSRAEKVWGHAYDGLYGVALVALGEDGRERIETPRSRSRAIQKSAGSLGLGTLLGAVFLLPVLGIALGGVAAAAFARSNDSGLSEQVLGRIRSAVPAGRSGIVMFSSTPAAESLSGELAGTTGSVHRVQLTEEEELELRSLIRGDEAPATSHE